MHAGPAKTKPAARRAGQLDRYEREPDQVKREAGQHA
jgi:hypothetical protein